MFIAKLKSVKAAGLTIIGLAGLTAITATAAVQNDGGIEIAAGPVYLTAGGDPGGLKTGFRDAYEVHLIVTLSKTRRIRIKP